MFFSRFLLFSFHSKALEADAKKNGKVKLSLTWNENGIMKSMQESFRGEKTEQ